MTLIRLLIGAISADSGNVRIMDYNVPDLKALNMIGYMPQNDALYNDLVYSGSNHSSDIFFRTDISGYFAVPFGLSGKNHACFLCL
jgi:ABC-type transport system involved in Fe-S cluster assembly fused permease/ATPase subunit